ncbi:caspase family protein [Pseudomonas sp. Z1-14]|uniref:caspase family protein n=1 Tax=Pseudomonas sp. Z1-14 TaxID=2817409 RepID=UPI003DA98EED
MNIAIVIGVDQYSSSNYENLPACKNDAKAIKAVIENVKDFKEITYLGNNEPASEIKKKISEIVEKYKDENLTELFFYFSGHGERTEDDFFYVPSDFDSSRKEATGIRNSEIDDWIKTLSPKLCIKVIDACFSGTQYIKSEFNAEDQLKKSAKKYGLNDIYFWFSSREDQSSFAGSEFSVFTESILTAISDLDGEVRYRDIMAAVADDFSKKGGPKPIFATQSDNIEKFGNITKETKKIINDLFGLKTDEESDTPSKSKPQTETTPAPAQESIYEIAKKKSNTLCFSEETLNRFLAGFKSEIQKWSKEINETYEITTNTHLSPPEVPNTVKIGEWLSEKTDTEYFAQPTYGTKNYQTEEYKALPAKPAKRDALASLTSGLAIARTLGRWAREEEVEYKLETVTKTSRHIDGFSYTHHTEDRIIKTDFKPTIQLAPPACLHVVIVYSYKELSIHFAYELLKRKNWEDLSKPTCNKWKTIKVNLNASKPEKSAAEHIKKDLINWLEVELKKRLE